MKTYIRTVDSRGNEENHSFAMSDVDGVSVIELGDTKIIDSGNGVTLFIENEGITLNYSQFHELCCIIKLDQFYNPNTESIELVTEQVNEL